MGLLSRGASLLNRALPPAAAPTTGAAAGTLTYTRGGTAYTVEGWVGDPERDETLEPAAGARLDDREQDFLVTHASMAAAGLGEPQRGDRITEAVNGGSVVWEVFPRDREPLFRWSDKVTKTRYRVHVRRVA